MLATLALLALALPQLPTQTETGRLTFPAAPTVGYGSRLDLDGHRLLSLAYLNNKPVLYIHDVTTGVELALLQSTVGPSGAPLAGIGIDGSRVIAGRPTTDGGFGMNNIGSAILFDTNTGAVIHTLKEPQPATNRAFGSQVAIEGAYLVVGSGINVTPRRVHVFDTLTGAFLHELVPQGNPFPTSTLALCMDGSKVYVAAGNEIHSFDVVTGNHLSRYTGTLSISAIQVSNNIALVSNPPSAWLVNVGTGLYMHEVRPVPDSFNYSHFGTEIGIDGNVAIVTAPYLGDSQMDGVFRYDVTTGEMISKMVTTDDLHGDHFPGGLALDGTTAVIGAPIFPHWSTPNGACLTYHVSGPNQGSAYCFGDGSGTPCPCGVGGSPGRGCPNGTSSEGALLKVFGNAEMQDDSFPVTIGIFDLPNQTPGVLLRGSNQVNGGNGNPAGDGLLCTAGQVARSHVQVASGGATLFSHFSGQSFASTSYGVGVPTNYQYWFRDTMGICPGNWFNFSNAVAVTWAP